MLLNKEMLGKGFKFPFRIGGESLSHDGPEQSKYEQHVIECLWHRILTMQKSRRGNRRFGSRLFEMTFEMITESPGIAQQFVIDAFDDEPRIKLISTKVEINNTKNQVMITADIMFYGTSRRGNLVFPFYNLDGRVSFLEPTGSIE